MVAILFLTQVFCTFAMTGLIWFVQVVHYPLFSAVPGPLHTFYAATHQTRTGWIVAPLMLLELATSLTLLDSRLRPAPASLAGALTGLALLGVIWLSTALLQVPLHGKLLHGFDSETHQRLVLTNWFRTAAWTARTVLLFCWLLPLC